MLDHGFLWVQFVKNEVSVGLVRCREDDNFIEFGQSLQELGAVRSYLVDFSDVIEMDQCLIKVENECIVSVPLVILGWFLRQQVNIDD
jgi:hypothetical protein